MLFPKGRARWSYGVVQEEEEEEHEADRRTEHEEGDDRDDASTLLLHQSSVQKTKKWTEDNVARIKTGLKSGLENRHIVMMAIGGVIGTGLFLGSAVSLQTGGPLGILLAYTILGTVLYCQMISMGEMISHLPVVGGQISLAARFGDPAFSFALGWAYCFTYLFLLPAELSAAAVLVGYWNKTISNAVWVTIFLTVVSIINGFGARSYGELEFWFSSIKVITIIGLIIVGIVISAGGGPTGETIGFKYWRDPGPFVQVLGIPGALGRFLGFWSVLIQATFAFIGAEIIGIAAAEAKNPRKSIPAAIKSVFYRVLIFYIVGVFIIGILVSSKDPRLNNARASLQKTAEVSPFVIAIEKAGIKSLPGVINAAILTSALSCASSNMFVSSRVLFGMSITGTAPKFFLSTTSYGLPWKTWIVSILFGLLAYTSAGSQSAAETFGYFTTLSSIGWLISWGGICVTYLRWYYGCKAQGIDRRRFPFYAPFQPYAAWWAIMWVVLILIFSGWRVFLKGHFKTSTFITSYAPIILFTLLYVGYKVRFKTRWVRAEDMDFNTGAAEVIVKEKKPIGSKEPWYMMLAPLRRVLF
ncbi:hypothetical protein BT69DRAFT_1246871 [Atractiella rhizophila]|nr:hypothetical protein BT69DRAFT_1246871 [Atractiella rhizophila]